MTWNRKIRPEQTEGLVPYTGADQNTELGEFGISAGFVKLDTTPTNTPETQGTMAWDVDNETISVILNGYKMLIGEDQFYPVKNQTGSTITKGTNVKFAGTVGASGRLLIAPFIADGTDPSYVYMGVTAENIANGEDGKVLWFGRLRGINTNAFEEGDILYASTTSAGGFQNTIPTGSNNVVQVAAVINKSSTQGVIFIRPQIEPLLVKPENVANKATNLTSPDNTKYPTTQAVVTELNGNFERILRSKANGVFGSHTGNTANTAVLSIPILGGEYEIGDFLTFILTHQKTNTGGTALVRVYAGTNGDLSDSLIATSATISSDNFYQNTQRNFLRFVSGNFLTGFRNVTSAGTDDGGSGAPTSASINPANNWFLTIAFQLTNASDILELTAYRVGRIKSQ
jgi:hypothetical protein